MPETGPRFEVIEDQPIKPKRRLKRKYRPLFGHLPWRGFAVVACIGVTAGFVLTSAINQRSQASISLVVTATPSPVAINLDAATPVWVNEPVLAVAHASQKLAVATQLNLRLYNSVALLNLLANTAGDHIALAFNPDGTHLASLTSYPGDGDGKAFATLKIWDTSTGALLREITAHQGGLNSRYWSVAVIYSPDGKWLATGAGDGFLALWDSATLEKRASISTLAAGTSALAFSSHARSLTAILEYGYTSSPSRWDATVEVWDLHDLAAPTRRYALSIFPYYAEWAALNTDGHYLVYVTRDSVLEADVLHIHDLLERSEIGAIVLEANSKIGPLAVSADGDDLAFVQQQTFPPPEPGMPPVEQKTIRTIWWWHGKDGFAYQSITSPQPLGKRGADHLHLWYEYGAMGLDYVSLDSNSLIRWNFANHTVLAIGL